MDGKQQQWLRSQFLLCRRCCIEEISTRSHFTHSLLVLHSLFAGNIKGKGQVSSEGFN